MLQWFWPGITWTAALTALALWFGADHVETDIATRSAQALEPYNWIGFDVDGRDVVLKGMAPDPEAQKAALNVLRNVRGIGDLSDLTTVLPVANPYVFKLMKNGEGIVLSGFIPDNSMRNAIMNEAESIASSGLVNDEMAIARGAPPEFDKRVFFVIDIVSKLSEAEIEISENALSLRGVALSGSDYDSLIALLNAPLALGLQLSSADIRKP